MKMKGMIAGLGIASLLVALPAVAGDKSSASSGSSGSSASGSMGSSGSGSASDPSSSTGSSGSSTMGSGSSSSEPGSSAGGTASAGSSSLSQITGKVEKVDQTKKQLSLQLKVDENTQVMKNGQRASLSDIKEGDQVRASFSGSQVQRIDVMSGAGSSSDVGGSSGGAGGSSTSPGSSGAGGSSGSSPGGSSGRGY